MVIDKKLYLAKKRFYKAKKRRAKQDQDKTKEKHKDLGPLGSLTAYPLT